jgi:hypothetical protein
VRDTHTEGSFYTAAAAAATVLLSRTSSIYVWLLVHVHVFICQNDNAV